MLSVLKEVLQKTLTFMGTQLNKHSKGQMEQFNKLTEEVAQMTSSHNTNNLAARCLADQEHSENSDYGEDDEENGIGSIFMKRILAFTMKLTWKVPFYFIRRPHHLQ